MGVCAVPEAEFPENGARHGLTRRACPAVVEVGDDEAGGPPPARRPGTAVAPARRCTACIDFSWCWTPCEPCVEADALTPRAPGRQGPPSVGTPRRAAARAAQCTTDVTASACSCSLPSSRPASICAECWPISSAASPVCTTPDRTGLGLPPQSWPRPAASKRRPLPSSHLRRVLANRARRAHPHLPAVARGGHVLQRAAQVPQAVGLADDVGVQRNAHHQRR